MWTAHLLLSSTNSSVSFWGTSVSAVLPYNMLLLQLLAHKLLHHQSLHYTVKSAQSFVMTSQLNVVLEKSMLSRCTFYVVTVASPCEWMETGPTMAHLDAVL